MESQNPFGIIDGLEAEFENSKRLLGKAYVGEEVFFVSMQRLRANLSKVGLQEDDKHKIFGIIEQMEHLVENGTGLFMGKKGVREESIFTLIQQLRLAISSATASAELNSENKCSTENPTDSISVDEFLRERARFLSEVENGRSFSIVREGKVIARLLPP